MAVKRRGAKKKVEAFNSYVVGIGASAGGLEAINDFFDNTPSDTGFAFVLVQHLSPDYKSLMPELLAKHTSMRIMESEDAMDLQPNSIYLLPSKKFISLREGKLRLENKVPNNKPNNAIDVFFESLASDATSKAIGVILSGTGTDGTKGLEMIKRYGGTAIVQDPVTAAFDGMPNSAINAGVADLILAPESMMIEAVDYLRESRSLRSFRLTTYKDEYILRDILQLIRKEAGHDFSHYKRPTLLRRLSKRLLELNIPKLKEYLDFLQSHPEEVRLISQDFLINVTYFFRDKAAFDAIQHAVIPAIMKDKKAGDTVKIWSVACSSGEEAYSFAILFHEYIERKRLYDVSLKIFATDIDRGALDKASKGLYPKSAMRDVPEGRLEKYFSAEGENYRIKPEIRKLIVFSFQDIVKDPPFSRMDLVACRNMLIYINAEAQREVIRKIHFAMKVGGFLFLGPSEHVGTANISLQQVDKKWRIFKNLSKARLNEQDQLFSPVERAMPFGLQQKTKSALQHVSELFKETLLEEFRFAGIFIDASMEVRQATGNYKDFIDLPEGGFNFNLIKLVKPDLGIALNVAIRRAAKDNQSVSMRRVKVGEGRKQRLVNIIVKPYLQRQDYHEQFYFIVLSEEIEKSGGGKLHVKADKASINKVQELEQELKETRENLQAVIEEIESANEELQSNNEEMVSTNEELQSTNEELQSLNEELHTVSSEHQLKIKELLELNDDLNNFFNNSDIGQVLVDKNMLIRRFSPSVTKMVNLIDSDMNRSILDITTRFGEPDFVMGIREVMSSGKAREREIMIDGTTYLLRITPYIRQDRSHDGVVISFINITETKKLTNMLSAIFDSSPSGISALRSIRNAKGKLIDMEFTASNPASDLYFHSGRPELKGCRLSQLDAGLLDLGILNSVIETGENVSFERKDPDTELCFEVTVVKLFEGVVVITTDVSDKKKAQDTIAQSFENLKVTSKKLKATNLRLEQSNMDLLQFASVASHDLKEPLRKIQTFGNLLMTKSKSKLAEPEQNYLVKIVSASGRMQKLIDDVLTLSKLSNRDQEFVEVDLNKVLRLIKDDLEITVKEKNADIKLEKLPVVKGISGQLHQIFQNLISNALKFTNGRKPEIIVRERAFGTEVAKRMNISPDKFICISVKDNGIGFEDAYKEKIFGIFQRLNGSEYDGTGIGLAICKKIMENHNGYIIAESELDKGSEFFIFLPKKALRKNPS